MHVILYSRLQFGLMYDFQNLTLTLRIIRATDLPAKDVTGTSDPYVKILLLPDKKHKLLTKVKKRNLNPHWNECFLFEGKESISLTDKMFCSNAFGERDVKNYKANKRT